MKTNNISVTAHGLQGSIKDAPFQTDKFCRWCAQMELDTATKMTPEERREYREKGRA